MSRRNWKKVYPTSLRQAMELCKEHALQKKNLSVERIAELMGMANHWKLYRWIAEGNMPAHMIRAFEHVCSIDLVSIYLAHSANKLVLPIPTGRKAQHKEINQLSLFMTETVQQLYLHQDGEQSAEVTIATLTHLMESLAYQRGNVEKEQQPELEL